MKVGSVPAFSLVIITSDLVVSSYFKVEILVVFYQKEFYDICNRSKVFAWLILEM